MTPTWKDTTLYFREHQRPGVWAFVDEPTGVHVAVHRHDSHKGRWLCTATVRGVCVVRQHVLRSTHETAAQTEALVHVRQAVRQLHETVSAWELGSSG